MKTWHHIVCIVLGLGLVFGFSALTWHALPDVNPARPPLKLVPAAIKREAEARVLREAEAAAAARLDLTLPARLEAAERSLLLTVPVYVSPSTYESMVRRRVEPFGYRVSLVRAEEGEYCEVTWDKP